MNWLILSGTLLALLFGLVVLFGAPYLPTTRPQIIAALELMELKKGDTLVDLGCGDGRILVAAAQKGYKVIGYELNPLLALLSWLRTRRHGGRVRVVWGNFWRHKLPECQGIFVFLHTNFMTKLDKKILNEKSGKIKVASFAFTIPGKKIAVEKLGVYLYFY